MSVAHVVLSMFLVSNACEKHKVESVCGVRLARKVIQHMQRKNKHPDSCPKLACFVCCQTTCLTLKVKQAKSSPHK